MSEHDSQQRPESQDDFPTHSDDGVDLTLIRWMLSLTPEQRLEYAQDHAQAIMELRDALETS